ncbi:unnamed protein product [Ceratitis capitata]|uniref:(Mediterranean fruit fly) hypothetical protein n=1 Tax=Ceratitis capitata TaxID=7213 RepID=A0A811VG11_CERCA|nr:unnamed protein product [Ceratitis capitata]
MQLIWFNIDGIHLATTCCCLSRGKNDVHPSIQTSSKPVNQQKPMLVLANFESIEATGVPAAFGDMLKVTLRCQVNDVHKVLVTRIVRSLTEMSDEDFQRHPLSLVFQSIEAFSKRTRVDTISSLQSNKAHIGHNLMAVRIIWLPDPYEC